MESILEIPEYRGMFRRWLLDQLIMRYPRLFALLRFRETLYLKGKGLRNSALDVLTTGTR